MAEGRVPYCDLCSLRGITVEDTLTHALGHCTAGEHCVATTASCAMEQSHDDHPTICCVCKQPIEDPCPNPERAESTSIGLMMSTALDPAPGEILSAMYKELRQSIRPRTAEIRSNSSESGFASSLSFWPGLRWNSRGRG